MGDFGLPNSLLSEWHVDLEHNELPPPNLSFTRLPPADTMLQQSTDNLSALPPVSTADALSLFSGARTEEEHSISVLSMPCIGPGPGFANETIIEPVREKSSLSVLSPCAVAQAPISANPPRLRLGPRLEIAKHSRGAGGNGKSVSGVHSQAEAKRLQHNQMMRENRERANRKFDGLQALLERSSLSGIPGSPPLMRNKMQVLDRAMVQYHTMCGRRARLRAELLLSEYSKSQTTQQITTTNMLARILLALQRWKAAEIWCGARPNLRLHTALLGSHNKLDTSNRLRAFCASRAAAAESTPDPLVVRAAGIQANMWVPDLRALEEASTAPSDYHNQASKYNVSTALYVPLKDAVLVLFHADDELLQFEGNVRPYDAKELGKVDELALRLRTP